MIVLIQCANIPMFARPTWSIFGWRLHYWLARFVIVEEIVEQLKGAVPRRDIEDFFEVAIRAHGHDELVHVRYQHPRVKRTVPMDAIVLRPDLMSNPIRMVRGPLKALPVLDMPRHNSH